MWYLLTSMGWAEGNVPLSIGMTQENKPKHLVPAKSFSLEMQVVGRVLTEAVDGNMRCGLLHASSSHSPTSHNSVALFALGCRRPEWSWQEKLVPLLCSTQRRTYASDFTSMQIPPAMQGLFLDGAH